MFGKILKFECRTGHIDPVRQNDLHFTVQQVCLVSGRVFDWNLLALLCVYDLRFPRYIINLPLQHWPLERLWCSFKKLLFVAFIGFTIYVYYKALHWICISYGQGYVCLCVQLFLIGWLYLASASLYNFVDTVQQQVLT